MPRCWLFSTITLTGRFSHLTWQFLDVHHEAAVASMSTTSASGSRLGTHRGGKAKAIEPRPPEVTQALAW